MKDVPVVIVGGGPVGLTASILLSQAGIGSMLVERHAGTAAHPRARAINGRTMEIYRQCGVEAAIRSAGLPLSYTGMIIWAGTLPGRRSSAGYLGAPASRQAPSALCAIACVHRTISSRCFAPLLNSRGWVN